MFRELVEFTVEAIEGLAIAIVVIVVIIATVRFLYQVVVRRPQIKQSYEQYKTSVAKSLLLALELLVAADIINTVVLEPTLASVAATALLVLVRTFLSWSLIVETEGHWPWKRSGSGDAPGEST
jgi:uncharacterized membrane protein